MSDPIVVVREEVTAIVVVREGIQGPPGAGLPNGGTTGQALVKASNADGDTEWSAPAPAAHKATHTTGGTDALAAADIGAAATSHTHAAADVTGTALVATLADAKGDMLVATGADVFARVAVGSDGHVWTADAASTAGAKWAAAAGGGGQSVITFASPRAGASGPTATLPANLYSGAIYLTVVGAGGWIEWAWSGSAGTYGIELVHSKANNIGIATVSIDGAALATTIDGYSTSATNVFDNVATITGVAVATSGVHTIRVSVLGKNAASSNWYFPVQGIRIYWTGA